MYEARELFGKTVTVQIPSDVFPTAEQIETMDAVTGAGCTHGWYESVSQEGDKNVNLHYRRWLPSGDQPLKGIVVFSMGILSETGHAARIDGRPLDMALVVDTFIAKGIAVYARDQLGHGLSEGTRFFMSSWKETRDDVINFVELVAGKHPTTIPLFLSGESFGGCLTILAGKHLQDHPEKVPNFDSSLLVCPAIIGDVPPFPVLQILRYVIAPLFPTRAPFFMPDAVSAERIWRDKKVLEIYQDPKKLAMGLDAIGERFRLGTAVSLLGGMEEVRGNVIGEYKKPFCIVHGSADIAVPIAGSELMYSDSMTPEGDKEFHAISETTHGVLGDPKAEEAMKYLSAFVDSRLKAFVPPKQE